MSKSNLLIAALILLSSAVSGAVIDQSVSRDRNVLLVASAPESVTLLTELTDLKTEISEVNGQQFSTISLPDEASTCYPGRPVLPMVSRFIIVSPTSNLELVVKAPEPRRVQTNTPPLLYKAEPGIELESYDTDGVFPPVIAEMGSPFIIRGVRMVKVTIYPVRYDDRTNEYLYYDGIETEVRSVPGEAVNPVEHLSRRGRSKTFLKFLSSVAINGRDVSRDDPDRDDIDRPSGHYLIVTHESCLPFIRPFIEWKRKVGYQVDILSIPANDATNSATVQRVIQDRYDEYIENGVDPFDELLLVGDRSNYSYGPNAQWVLESATGTTNWGGPRHADYFYACLEGDDEIPDVGFARWEAGSEPMLDLFAGRTLGYEATPDMENSEWFERAAAFSQHWGNSSTSEWHPSVHLTARWGLELLRQKSFRNVQHYEYFPWDQQGNRIGPWLEDQMNAQTNVMIGFQYLPIWRSNFPDIDDNTVFPIYLIVGNHGDLTTPAILRYGDGDHMKGPVAMCFTVGELGTTTSIVPNSFIWMEMVKAFLVVDLPLGWARTCALIAFEGDMPNMRIQGFDVYPMYKTDFDVIGDPGLQPWLGIPRLVEAELLTGTEPDRRFFEVEVTDPDGDPVTDAIVTFYAPGSIPNNQNEYADYNGYVTRTTLSDQEGHAQFLFDIGQEFIAGTPLFITITGRDIRPFFLESRFAVSDAAIEVADFNIDEIEGNGDRNINPGELAGITIIAQNNGHNALSGVTATVTSSSHWVEVEGEDEIDFGDIASGEESNANRAISVRINPSCPDGALHPENRPELRIEFSYEGGNSSTAIQLDPVAPGFEFVGVVGGSVIPDTVYQLDLLVMNSGRMDAPRLSATIHNRGLGVSVLDGHAEFPATESGEEAQLVDNLFTVAGNRVVVPGSQHELMLTLESEGGWRDSLMFNLQVSTPREHSPQGPDGYGYICFDDTDSDWDIAPEYEWIEINPETEDHEFEGELLDFEGQSEYDIGEAQVIPLGFWTQFYGQLYDSVTVATNGFITPGSQPGIVSFQNYPLDRGIGGGAGMIAPLWTDLRMDNNSAVYSYYDEGNARTIIEWSGMRYTSGNLQLTFEVILYDHDVWITETGDQNILFQYKEVEIIRNVRQGDTPWETAIPYPSVGISSPDCKTGISYAWNNEYPVTSAPIQNNRALLFTTSPRYLSCTLIGWVRSVENWRPVEGVHIYTRHGFVATTDERGYWEIPDALAEVSFSITASKQGFNDSTVFIEDGVPEGESFEIDIDLLHPEFSLDRWEFRVNLDPDQIIETDFTLSNRGNGPLEWTAEKRLLGDANAGPWELRRRYNVSRITEDYRIESVVFAEDRFFLSGANVEDTTLIYVLDREGALTDSFSQINSTRYGYKDLEWDGENIWAVGDDTVYCFSTEGQLVTSWPDPLNPSQYIAFNNERGILYLAGTTSHIFECDREGNLVQDHIDPVALRQRRYGLGYWPEDPDGFDLYILNRPGRDTTYVIKMNVETGDTATVVSLPTSEGSMGYQSIWITNEFDIYSWVLMCVENISSGLGGDKLSIFQLDARKDWMNLNRWSDRLETGETQDFVLTLNSMGLPDTTFVGEMLFHHNADSGVAHVSIELTVGNPPLPHIFELLLPANGDTLYDTEHNFPEVRFVWRHYIDPSGEDPAIAYVQRLTVDWESVQYAVNDTFNVIDLDSLRQYLLLEGTLTWRVAAVSGRDTVWCQEPFTLVLLPLSAEIDPLVPLEFGIVSMYPNPFNAVTSVRFGVERDGNALLCAYDLQGRRVGILCESDLAIGYHNVSWNAGNLASGIYLLKLESAGRKSVRKVALLR